MYDLIIAGAGPAGSSAAMEAAKRGCKTLLIDKDSFPRYKPCGGGLSERAISYLDLALPDHICERNITGARICYGESVLERHKEYRLTVTLNRSVFDDLLLESAKDAGANVLTGQMVNGYVEKDDCVMVQSGDQLYRSKYLMVSSGSQSRLIEGVREQDGKDRYGICIVAEVPEENCAIDERIGNALEIHFGVAQMGYGWIFPHDGYYSVGIGGLASVLSNPRSIMTDFLGRNGFVGSYNLRGHLIPFGGVNRRLATARVLLAGDSAGFVDSFTGEGISYAIRSGQIAASAVAEKLHDDMNLATAYSSRCAKEFGEDLRYSLILARMMHKHPGFFFRMLTSREDFLDKFLEIPAMRGTYKGVVKWLIPRIPGCILNV
jgi:geranylgeranyl reductase family protein